jgi:hypothetical protein
MYPAGVGLSDQLAMLNYLWVSSLHLQKISMSWCFYQITLILTGLPKLRTLDVSDNSLGWGDIYWTARDVVWLNTSITKFSMGGNREYGTLTNFIQTLCTSLKYLDVSRMCLEKSMIRKMARVLQIAGLTTINLEGNILSARKTLRIIQAVTLNTTLTSLDLGNNRFCQEGANAMAGLVAVNTTITKLGISRTFTHHVCTVLDEITRDNTMLTHLDISQNRFSGFILEECIAAMLRGNTPLRVLNLRGCRMLPWTVVTVAEAVSQHPTLTVLLLVGNKMDSQYICNLARTCTRLVDLEIGTSNMV